MIVTSPDGVTWTERWRGKEIYSSWGEHQNFSAVAVAVGNGIIVVNAPRPDECAPQSFLVSTNSLSWVEVQTGLSNGCIQSLHLSYGLGRFVAVVLAQTPFVGVPDNKVLISGDGFTWENISENWDIFGEYPYGDALGFGNGSFFFLSSVYTNDSSGNTLTMPIALTSTDGRSWTEHAVTGLESGIGHIHEVSRLVYAQNVFVIVGQPQFGQTGRNGFPYIFTSPDGMNWSSRVGGIIYGLSGVAASDRRVVAVGDVVAITNSSTVILASADGMDWRQTQQFGGQFSSSIIYGSGLFVVAGNSGILTSPDGVTWSRQTNAGAGWSRLRLGMNRILALGGELGTDGTYHYKLATSSDGLAWAIQRMDNVIYPRDVATDGHSVVLIDERNDGSGGVPRWSIWRSAESSTWVEVYRDSTPSPRLVAYGNGHYLIPEGPFNRTGSMVLISSDGVNWAKQAPVIENGIGDLIFDGIIDLIFANGQFYATDYYGTPEVLSSPDGVRWKAHPTGFHQQLLGLAAGPQGLFALGSAGGILHSPWDLVLSGPERALNGALRINVTGPPGANVQIQRGATLSDWSNWQTIQLSDAPVQVEDAEVAASSQRFYRAFTR